MLQSRREQMLNLNVNETELEWFLYQLQSKSTVRAPTFSFRIADSVVMRQGIPVAWYYSAPDGSIKVKRKPESLRFPTIAQAFLTSSDAQSDEPAATSYIYRN